MPTEPDLVTELARVRDQRDKLTAMLATGTWRTQYQHERGSFWCDEPQPDWPGYLWRRIWVGPPNHPEAGGDTTSAIPAVRLDLAALRDALTAVRRRMAASSRDWSLAKGDAWLYAILVGWNDDPDEPALPVSALANIAIRHGWSLGDMAALEAMRAAIVALDEAMA